MRRLFLLIFFAFASGCVGASVRPLAIANTTVTGSHFKAEHLGVEVAGTMDEGFFGVADVNAGLVWLPMVNKRSGESADVYLANAVVLFHLPIVPKWDPWLRARVGYGASFLAMQLESGNEMFGGGLCGRAGLGSSLGDHVQIEVFGDAHGWYGGDHHGACAGWLMTLGAALSVSF